MGDTVLKVIVFMGCEPVQAVFKNISFGTKFFEKMDFFLIFVVLLFNLVNSKHLDKFSSKYKILIRKVF